MSFIGIIPARYQSKRLPGKPLALLGDKPMIQWVYERASAALDRVVVATDDRRILDVVRAFGGEAVLTGDDHRSGTSRVCEAYRLCGSEADIVVNIQGDEPFVEPAHIRALKRCFSGRQDIEIATLISPFDPALGFDRLSDCNVAKVVVDHDGYALYFSRSVIPYVRNLPPDQWLDHTQYYTHIGIYAYRAKTLREIVELPVSPLQKAESLEQLSWLQHGYRIYTASVDSQTIGVDTPDDLRRARLLVDKLNNIDNQ